MKKTIIQHGLKARADEANRTGDFALMRLLDATLDALEKPAPGLSGVSVASKDCQAFLDQFEVLFLCLADRKTTAVPTLEKMLGVDLASFHGEDAWESLASELQEILHPELIQALKKELNG